MKAQPFQYRGREVMTLRQLDELNGVPKGTSFRAFKRVRPYLEAGEDFFCLAANEQLQLSEVLRQCALVYPASVSIVLVTRRGYQRMQQDR
ncbi:MAG: ORF6N domain-containing protein [Nitrococcus sp.]|nr:ORF6N domain-containing protein [Nitrococcus sp.]